MTSSIVAILGFAIGVLCVGSVFGFIGFLALLLTDTLKTLKITL
ncbi:hypothetical protein [Helicobacter pylori]|nr:hypothetical protein [Helicobacter pylori]